MEQQQDETKVVQVLTADCRFTGLDHGECVGHIYLGSIFGKPSACECECHAAYEMTE